MELRTQEEIIQQNLLRWKMEQKHKEEKRAKLAVAAAAQGITPKELLAKRRQRYLLQNCRATIGEIIKERS